MIIINYIWKLLKKQLLKKEKIILKGKVYFNKKTKFEDNIVINKNSYIYDSYIARGTYLGKNCEMSFSKIGRFCSIGNNVHVINGNHPTHKWMTTHPAFFSIKKQSGFSFVSTEKWKPNKKLVENYDCIIGNDVWIGNRVTILPGVKIANGSIIGAGSVVTKSTEPYAIYVGVPAKKIKERFNKGEILELEKIEWWNYDMQILKQNAIFFQDIKNIKILKGILK